MLRRRSKYSANLKALIRLINILSLLKVANRKSLVQRGPLNLSLVKGKDKFSGSLCTIDLRLATFSYDKIFFTFTKQDNLTRRSTVLSLRFPD
jgi:hypothetical protein